MLYTQFVPSKLVPLSVERRRNPWHGGPPLITKRLSRRVAVTGLPCGAGKTLANPLLLLLEAVLRVVAVLLVVVLPKRPSSHSRSATPSGAAIVRPSPTQTPTHPRAQPCTSLQSESQHNKILK